MLRIRPVTIADLPLLRPLAEKIWRHCYAEILAEEQITFMLADMYSPECIAAEIARGIHWELAELEATPVALLAYELEPDTRVKLHKLYLLPELHGRGHGAALLAHVLAKSRTLGATEIWLQVNKRNAPAIAAYRRAGYTITREAVLDIGHGYVRDDYFMARPV